MLYKKDGDPVFSARVMNPWNELDYIHFAGKTEQEFKRKPSKI